MLKGPQLAICVALEEVGSAIAAALLSDEEPVYRIAAACRKLGEFTSATEFGNLPANLRKRIRSLQQRGELLTSGSEIAPIIGELLDLYVHLRRNSHPE